LSDWANRALLWDKLLDLRGQTRDLVGEVVETRGALIQAASTELGVQLHQALETFPSVTLIPFGWVATFIFGYLILIGPIDYLFLRRVARRMEMTWLTFPLIVLATTLGAYWVASALKGTTPRVNKLDLLDLDQASGRLRGTSWWTLYSTANRDFSISLKPQPPNGRSDTQWRLELGRTCTWYSPDESALVGVGRVALMSKPSVYAPAGQLERIEDLRIPIWSTRSFTGRWYGQAPGVRLVDAELRTVAGDRAVGSIRNLLDTPLRNAQLYYGKNVYELGTIRPRGVGRVDYSRAEAVARQLTRLVQKAQRWQHETEHSDEDEAAKMRADLLRAILFHDSMGSRAEAYPSQSLAHLDMSGQMNELRRPMLVAEVDTPAAELQLTGDPAKPAVKQSTVVRIILEMTASETPDL
jgi:hypothetical protein